MDPPQKPPAVTNDDVTPGYPINGPGFPGGAGYPGSGAGFPGAGAGFPGAGVPYGSGFPAPPGQPNVPPAGRQMGQLQQGQPIRQPLPSDIPNVPGAQAVAQALRPAFSPADYANAPKVEHLSQFQALFVKQRIDLTELAVNYDVSNQYDVFMTAEHRKAKAPWLYAREESDCFQRACAPRCREYTLDVGLAIPMEGRPATLEQTIGLVDAKHVVPMLRIFRPFSMCKQDFTVSDDRGRHIASGAESCGTVIGCCFSTTTHLSRPGVTEVDGSSAEYSVTGPSGCHLQYCGTCPCRGEFEFDMRDRNGRLVGRVVNEPVNIMQTMLTNADDYRIEFRPEATVAERAILLSLAVRAHV